MPDWIDTGTESEASNYAEQFWSKLSYSLSDGAFWADEIKKLRDKPDERLAMAMAHLPLPAAFSEAAVALRAMIRIKKKEGVEWQQDLTHLYNLAAWESFTLPYAPRLERPGMVVTESIPGLVVCNLEFSYKKLGYLQLQILNKTDHKWLVEAWGEPDQHTTLNELHRAVWDHYEDLQIAKQNSRMSHLSALVAEAKERQLEQVEAPSTIERKWWQFWK